VASSSASDALIASLSRDRSAALSCLNCRTASGAKNTLRFGTRAL
jgi:hypothetical protein